MKKLRSRLLASTLLAPAAAVLMLPAIARAQTATGTLNMANYTQAQFTDFSKVSSLSALRTTTPFTNAWDNGNGSGSTAYWFTGNPNQGVLIYSSSGAGSGFQEPPTAKTAGHGYGLYTFQGYASQPGQGVGICFLLWPADNVWLPSAYPGKISELDVLEDWNNSAVGTGQSTWHFWQDPTAPASKGTNNGQVFNTITGIDITKSHTYAVDWEKNEIDYYVDGSLITSKIAGVNASNGTTDNYIPLDAADGGVNKTLGAEVVQNTGPVGLYIQSMGFYTRNAGNAVVANEITLTPPTLTTGVAGAVTGSDNYVIPGSLNLSIDGAAATAVTPTVNGNSFTVPVPSTLSAGSHTFAVTDATNNVTSNTTTGTVSAAVVTDTLSLNTPSGLNAGAGGNLTGVANYVMSASVTLKIDGAVSTVTSNFNGGNYSIALPTTLTAGSHTFQVIDGSNASSPTVTATVAGVVVPAITLTAPTGLVNGTAGKLSGTDNYTLGSTVSLVIDGGSPATVTPTVSGNSFTVPLPNNLAVGSHTFQLTDGSTATSNTVTASVTAAPATGSVPQPKYFASGYLLTGPQLFAVNLSSSVTSAVVDWNATTPTLGASDNVAVQDIGTATPYAQVNISNTSGAAMWLSVNGGPFVKQFQPGLYGQTASLTISQPSNLQTGAAGVLPGTTNTSLPTSVTLVIDGVESTVPVTQTGNNYTVPLPATLASGSHAVQVKDGGKTLSNIETVTVGVADNMTLTAPTGLVSGQAGTLAGIASYSLPSSVTLRVDGAATTVAPTQNGQNFTVPLPTTLTPGAHTFVVIDGTNATSNTVSSTVVAVAIPVTGAVAAPASLLVGTDSFTATLSSSVTSAVADLRLTSAGTPALGDADNVTLTAGQASQTISAPVSTPSVAYTMWLSLNGGPFVSQWSATSVSTSSNFSGSLSLTVPSGMVAGQAATLPGVASYATLPATLSLVVDGGAGTSVTPTYGTSGNFTVPVPALTAGSHTLEVMDPGNASVVSNTVTVTVAATFTDTLVISPPTLTAGQAAIMSGTHNYAMGSSVTLKIDNNSSVVPAVIGTNTFTVPLPPTLAVGTHTIQVIDGSNAASNILSVAVQPAPNTNPLMVPAIDPSAMLTLPGTTTPRTLADRLGGATISPLDFGAKCDGATDDSQAFVAATTAALAKGHAVISLPAAVCRLSTSWTIPVTGSQSIVVQGAGSAATTLLFDAGAPGGVLATVGASTAAVQLQHFNSRRNSTTASANTGVSVAGVNGTTLTAGFPYTSDVTADGAAPAGTWATPLVGASVAPAHSTTPCSTGQTAWDAASDYRCVAPNSWQATARGTGSF